MKEKLLRFVPYRLRNRYGAGILCFIAWIAFFDDHDLYTTYKLRRELSSLKEDHAYYAAEIQVTRERIHQLNSDAALLEKFARERYMFKRDNEDIFVLVAEEPKK
ncbi:MAG: septum formation initiator family protein [Flavobacteriales bacterium]|nr:septum formation initiator family protein [Flavobacteriales bacterium]